jgi:hypothetical protein
LRLPGFFENLPQNLSWKYFATSERPEMLFHFKKFGGNLGWIIEAIPYAVAEREEFDAKFLQLGRESFRAEPLAADISDLAAVLAKAGRRDAEIGMTTETSGFQFPAETLSFPATFASFKNDDNSTLVEFYFGIAGKHLQPDTSGYLHLRHFIGFYDELWYERVKVEQRDSVALGMHDQIPEDFHVTDFERFVLLPGIYSYESQVQDLTTGDIGLIRGKYDVPRYSSDSLMLSDVLISSSIMPAGSDPRYNKGEISYRPHMFTRFKKNEQIGLYFELYNLALNDAGQTDFRITCSLQGSGAGESAMRRLTGFFKSIFSDDAGFVGTSYDYKGNSRDEKLYMNIKVEDDYTGKYELVIAATDLLMAVTTEKRVEIVFEQQL